METDKYKTISAKSEGIYKEKGSKFLAFAYPVSNLEQIKAILEQINKDYFDARHRCYAYRLGPETYRLNDDGEPSGTAGKPIYGQLLSNELTNILVVVVRYFGGILLGTSGLIVAYKSATLDAINNAEIIEKFYEKTLKISFEYLQMNDIMKILKDSDAKIISQNFELSCQIIFTIRTTQALSISEKLSKFGTLEEILS